LLCRAVARGGVDFGNHRASSDHLTHCGPAFLLTSLASSTAATLLGAKQRIAEVGLVEQPINQKDGGK
jgi:hypothetical protein